MTVYYIRANNGAIKIGYTSKDVNSRLQSLSTSSPLDLELVAYEDGGLNLEKQRHDEYAQFNIRGEWFIPSDELNEKIKELNPNYTPDLYFNQDDYFYAVHEFNRLTNKINNIKLWYQTGHYDPPKLFTLAAILGGMYIFLFLLFAHTNYIDEIVFGIATGAYSLIAIPAFFLGKIWQIRKMFSNNPLPKAENKKVKSNGHLETA